MVRRKKKYRFPVGGSSRRYFDPGKGKRPPPGHYYDPGFRFEPGLGSGHYSLPGTGGGFFLASLETIYGVF